MEPPPRVGTYWIASEPEERRDGLLNLRRGAGSELTVEPEFYSCFERVVEVAADGSTIGSIGLATDRGPQTVHGQLAANGKGGSVAVSLLQADSTNWTGSTQTFRPIWSILGGHVEPHHPFRGVRLRISGYAPAPHASVSLETGGTVRLDPVGPWLELIDLPLRTYRELERTVIRPICTLLTLATGERVRPSEVQLSPEPDTWWPIYTASQGSDNPEVSDGLVPTSEITIPVIATWLARAPQLGPLPAGVASVWEANLAVETQVLILTTIAEGLHRALFPEVVRFTPEYGKTIQDQATAAVHELDTEAAIAVHGYLEHVYEVGYNTRLRDLAARAEGLVPGITGRSTKWRTLVYDTRNRYAHQPSTEWMEEADIDRVLTVSQSLRWVLRLLLLHQAGLNPGLIAKSFLASQSYSFFLNDAAGWQPRIYPG